MSVVIEFGGVDPVPLEQARVVILPVPYQGTVSYGNGTAQGPTALLAASTQMELFDEVLQQETIDLGFHTLTPVEPDLFGPAAMMERIAAAARPQVAAGRFLAGIGGEHSITDGLLRAFLPTFGRRLSVLQIDAHADLRDQYQGSPHSHACVMRRVAEMGLEFVQVGIRSLSREEWEFVQNQGRGGRIFWARDVVSAARRGETGWMDQVVAALGPEVYVTVDLDGLDPSVLPATGTPEPGGLDYPTLLTLLERVARRRRIVGCDLTELAPLPGQPASDFLASRLLYRLIGLALAR
ncbi:MAG: agmatinase [Magnetococcales bacterium]|nr:agmatinase [Magnetococcales bacterium]